jgi:hypothetical protein
METSSIVIKKEVPVAELRLGMYVVELDRPWLGTPFHFQSSPITAAGQMETLQSLRKVVFVDPDRDEWGGRRAAQICAWRR